MFGTGLSSVLFTEGRLQVYLDSSFVRTRKVTAYEEEEEPCLGISCFERDVLYQIVYLPGLPEICSLYDSFCNTRGCFPCRVTTYRTRPLIQPD